MLKEFKKFISKGNVVDLAVGVIIGGAFGKIVSSLVNDILMPIIGAIIGGIDFSDLSVAKQGGIRLADTLKEQKVEALLTTKSTLPIWERNTPEAYQWFCENYTVEKSFPIYDEEYQYYVRK